MLLQQSILFAYLFASSFQSLISIQPILFTPFSLRVDSVCVFFAQIKTKRTTKKDQQIYWSIAIKHIRYWFSLEYISH